MRQLAIFDLDNNIQTLRRHEFEIIVGLPISPNRVNTNIFTLMLYMIMGGVDVEILSSSYYCEQDIKRWILKRVPSLEHYIDRVRIITCDYEQEAQGEEFKKEYLYGFLLNKTYNLIDVIRDTDIITSIILKEDSYYDFSITKTNDYRDTIKYTED
jgi:hypothetical protein